MTVDEIKRAMGARMEDGRRLMNLSMVGPSHAVVSTEVETQPGRTYRVLAELQAVGGGWRIIGEPADLYFDAAALVARVAERAQARTAVYILTGQWGRTARVGREPGAE